MEERASSAASDRWEQDGRDVQPGWLSGAVERHRPDHRMSCRHTVNGLAERIPAPQCPCAPTQVRSQRPSDSPPPPNWHCAPVPAAHWC